MADALCFAFGETDSYFYNGLNTWSWRNLPPGVQQEFRNDDYKYIDTYNLAIGPNEKWYIGGRRKTLATGMLVDNNAWSNNLPEKLANWLPTCDMRTLRVVFGSGDAYFAWDKNGYCYDCIPPAMAAEFEKLTTKGGPGAIVPRTMALGHGGSFFFVTENDMFAYDLTGCSVSLDQEFDSIFTRQGGDWFGKIKHITINPHKEGEYFLIDGQGVAMGKFPDTWDSDCSPVHASIKTYFDSQPPPLTPTSPSLSPPVSPPDYTAARGFPGTASSSNAVYQTPASKVLAQFFNGAAQQNGQQTQQTQQVLNRGSQPQITQQQAAYSQLLAQKQANQAAQVQRQKQAQRVSLFRAGFKLGNAIVNTANNLAGNGNLNLNSNSNVNSATFTGFNSNVNQTLAVNNAILQNQLAADNAYNAALVNQIAVDNACDANAYDNGVNAGFDSGFDAGAASWTDNSSF